MTRPCKELLIRTLNTDIRMIVRIQIKAVARKAGYVAAMVKVFKCSP
jgi:hypothetical protein